jgi:hypothetical protein
MTREQILKKFPNASESTLRANATTENRSDGLRANNAKPIEGRSLERPLSREDSSRAGTLPRFRIVFTVYATRPADWDNYSTKQLQDMVVRSGILSGDDWGILEGSVISRKAHSKAEEGTAIEITQL